MIIVKWILLSYFYMDEAALIASIKSCGGEILFSQQRIN